MTPQTYVIVVRDARLAAGIGVALEDRLSGDGQEAVALVPAGRWLERARPGRDGPAGGAPQVVALYEDGLLEQLETLGLNAYVGVSPEQECELVRWHDDAGALLLPVTSARDLVEAVAEHTPWPRGARPGRSPALGRKLAAAGVAAPLLLASLPSAAAAADTPAQAPAASGQGFWSRVGGAIQNYMTTYGQAQLDNAQANLAMGQQINSWIGSAWPSWPTPFQGGERGLVYGTATGVGIGAVVGGGLGAFAGPEGVPGGAILGGRIGAALTGAYEGAYIGGERGLIYGTAVGTGVGAINQHNNGANGTSPQSSASPQGTDQQRTLVDQAGGGSGSDASPSGLDGTASGSGGTASSGTGTSSNAGTASSATGTSSNAGTASSGTGGSSGGSTASAGGSTSSTGGNTSSGGGSTSSGGGSTS